MAGTRLSVLRFSAKQSPQQLADAMEEAGDYTEGYDNQNGMSERRGRSMTTGRYVSRTAGGMSYADGYNEGYSEAMRQMGGNSEHYPMMPQNYGPRRW